MAFVARAATSEESQIAVRTDLAGGQRSGGVEAGKNRARLRAKNSASVMIRLANSGALTRIGIKPAKQPRASKNAAQRRRLAKPLATDRDAEIDQMNVGI